jgi:hypothetical protein
MKAASPSLANGSVVSMPTFSCNIGELSQMKRPQPIRELAREVRTLTKTISDALPR